MPKRKRPEETPKEQFERFQEAAKQLDVSSAEGDATFRRLARRGQLTPKDHSKDKSK